MGMKFLFHTRRRTHDLRTTTERRRWETEQMQRPLHVQIYVCFQDDENIFRT